MRTKQGMCGRCGTEDGALWLWPSETKIQQSHCTAGFDQLWANVSQHYDIKHNPFIMFIVLHVFACFCRHMHHYTVQGPWSRWRQPKYPTPWSRPQPSPKAPSAPDAKARLASEWGWSPGSEGLWTSMNVYVYEQWMVWTWLNCTEIDTSWCLNIKASPVMLTI